MDERIKRSRIQERKGAKDVGGRVTPGSGNQWHTKNDVRTDTESFEFKSTLARQFTLRLNDLKQAEKYALLDDRSMVFAIDIQGSQYAILTWDDYLTLREMSGDGS